MRKKRALIMLFIWIAGIPASLLFTNWGITKYSIDMYTDATIIMYVDKCEEFLEPEEYERNHDVNISAVLALRGLLDKSIYEVETPLISIRTDTNIQFLRADGDERFTKGTWVTAVKADDDDSLNRISNSIGLVSVDRMKTEAFFDKLYSAMEKDILAKVRITEYGYRGYEIVPLKLEVVGNDGKVIEKLESDDVPEGYDIAKAQDIYIFTYVEKADGKNIARDSDQNFHHAIKLANEPEREVDSIADGLAADVDWSKGEANNIERYKKGLGSYILEMVKVSGDYAMIMVVEKSFLPVLIKFSLVIFAGWTFVLGVISLFVTMGKKSSRN